MNIIESIHPKVITPQGVAVFNRPIDRRTISSTELGENAPVGLSSLMPVIRFRTNAKRSFYWYYNSEAERNADFAYLESVLTSDNVGSIVFFDTKYTEKEPLKVKANTLTQIPNNAAKYEIKDQSDGIANWVVDGKFRPPNDNNDCYIFRASMCITSSSKNRKGLFSIDIGTDQSPIPIYQTPIMFLTDSMKTSPLTTVAFQLYTGSTFFANGGSLSIKANGALEVYDVNFFISRYLIGLPQ